MENRTFLADDRLNDFNDRDEMWGPLLSLRPERRQVMSPVRVLVISSLLGGFYGMLGNVVLGLLAHAGSTARPSLLMMPALLTGMYFVCAQVSIVSAWNRRARSLSRRQDWMELTHRPVTAKNDEQRAD